MDDQVFVPALTYKDPKAALLWLESAFGFEVTMLIDGPEGEPEMGHYEMDYKGNGRIMVGAEWSDHARSPISLEGKNTQTVHLTIAESVDEHCERARAAGAEIVMEPEDQFYGDRTYRARDLEGHYWVIGQHVRDVTRTEAEAAIGLPITSTNWE